MLALQTRMACLQVPVLVDGDTTIADSWRIAEYLEENYKTSNPLFGSVEGRPLLSLGACQAQ